MIIARYHVDSEDAIRDSGLAGTILQPNEFTSNALRWRPQILAGDVIRAPVATVRSAAIDPHDIAAVSVAEGLGREPRSLEQWARAHADAFLVEALAPSAG